MPVAEPVAATVETPAPVAPASDATATAETAAAPIVEPAPAAPVATDPLPIEEPKEPTGRSVRKRWRGVEDAGDAGRATQSARTGGLLTTASGRQALKAAEEDAVFRRERILDVYHCVESLCFYTAKEISAQTVVVDGVLTLRIPHGVTNMCVCVGDLLETLPKHVLALRFLSPTNAEQWFPSKHTHWGLETSDGLPEYARRALSLLETLCDVAASGKHRRLYQKISSDVVQSAQDLALLASLELASKKKIKRKIGASTPSAESVADAKQFLELAKTAAQTLKSVCTLYEWRDPYVAAAAAAWPPRMNRKPDGAPGSDTLLDAVVNGAFVALRRATPPPGVGIVKSVAEVAPARALLAGAARLAGVEGAAGVLAKGGVDRLRPVLRLGLAAVRLAAATPEDPAPVVARAAAEAAWAEAAAAGAAAVAAGATQSAEAGDANGAAADDANTEPLRIPSLTAFATEDQRNAMEARNALLPVATHGLGLLQTLLDLETETQRDGVFSFLDAAAEDDGYEGCAPLLAAAVGAVLRACAEAIDTQVDSAREGWRGEEGKGWVLERFSSDKDKGNALGVAAPANVNAANAPASAEAAGEFTDLMADDTSVADAEKAAFDASARAEQAKADAEQREANAAALAFATNAFARKQKPLPSPLGRGAGALLLAAMRAAEALSVDSSTQSATMHALCVPLARVLTLEPETFSQWWCGGAAARFAHADDDNVTTAATVAADHTARSDKTSPRVTATYRADLGCRIPAELRETLALRGTLKTAERALLLHHLLGNLHIHAPGEDDVETGRFLELLVRRLGGGGGVGSGGGETYENSAEAEAGDSETLTTAFGNLAQLHQHVKAFPEGTVAAHDVAIVRTLLDEFGCHLPGGGGAEAAAVAAAASASAAAAAAPASDDAQPTDE